MGVTAATPANLVVGAGDVYLNDAILGASIDDNAYRIERDYFTPELNGVKGFLKGTTYIDRSEAILEASIPEMSATIMEAMLPGMTNAGGTIDEDEGRRIPDEDYNDWKLVVEGLNGRSFSFEADNGINLGNVDSSLGDASVYAPRAEVHSTWDAAALTASPHRIVITEGS